MTSIPPVAGSLSSGLTLSFGDVEIFVTRSIGSTVETDVLTSVANSSPGCGDVEETLVVSVDTLIVG